MKTLGPNFGSEVADSPLAGKPFAWSADGEVTGRENLTAEENAQLDALIAAHDPAKLPDNLYRRLRAVAYRDEMGVERGDFVLTIGDVLDAVLEQIFQMGEAGEQLTDEMTALLSKRAAIKARIPKP